MPKRRRRDRVQKAITTPALDDGGRLHPAGYGDGMLDEEDKGPVELTWIEGAAKRIHTDPAHVFLCARLPEEARDELCRVSRSLAEEDGLEPEDVDHITVLFIPPSGTGEVPKETVDRLEKLAAEVAAKAGPIRARLQGWGYFDGAEKDGKKQTALVALVDAPGLAELHVAMKEAAVKAGLPVKDQSHGYVPHATALYLRQGGRASGDLPVLGLEFEIDKIELVHSDVRRLALRKEDLPADGLIISPSLMAQAIVEGAKKLIVKTRPFDIAGQRLLLLSQRHALGVVELGDMREMSLEDLKRTWKEHLITDLIREEWAEQQEGWKEGPFYAWPVEVAQAFDEPRETNAPVGPQVLVHGIEVKGSEPKQAPAKKADPGSREEKIRDPEAYDPSKVDDAVLRDDFRIVLAWYATHRRDPKGFKHSLETIETLLRKILKEAVRRGPDVITFDPKGMSASVRDFFLRVAREVKVPEGQFKRLRLLPTSDPGGMTTEDLTAAHRQLHVLYAMESRGEGARGAAGGWSVEDVVNLHARVVDELFERKVPHPAPPDNGLDGASDDFERHLEEQPRDWTKVDTKKAALEKRQYATVNPSGDQRGRKIYLGEVLEHLKSFKLRKPYIYLVGGLAIHGETEGDIDILVRDTEDLPESYKHAIHFRLGRALPADLSERLQVHFDNFHGPFTDFVELYDLKFERVNPQNEVKEMSAGDLPANVVTSVDDLRAFLKRRGGGGRGG